MKNIILHPTDFSECAQGTLKYTIEVAKILKSEIRLIHILEFDGNLNLDQDDSSLLAPTKKEYEDANSKIKNLEQIVKDSGIGCDTEIIEGEVVTTLPNYINALNPLLVSMGVNGSNTLSNKLFGTHTYNIIKNSKTPVLAVPLSISLAGSFSNFILSTNYKTKDIEAIEFLTKLATPSNAKIDVVHIVNSAEETNNNKQKLIEEMAEKMKGGDSYANLDFNLLYGENIADRLQILIKEQQPDLLTMVMRKRGFFELAFFGSVTQKLVNHTNIPLLIFANN